MIGWTGDVIGRAREVFRNILIHFHCEGVGWARGCGEWDCGVQDGFLVKCRERMVGYYDKDRIREKWLDMRQDSAIARLAFDCFRL